MSRDGVDQLFTLLESRGAENELKNLWLMAPSVRKVFRGGHIKFIKSPYLEEDDGKVTNFGEDGGVSSFPFLKSELEIVSITLTWVNLQWKVQRFGPEAISPAWLGGCDSFYKPPTTADPDNYPLPVDFLLSTHRRISINLHVYTIEDRIRRGWPPIGKGPTPESMPFGDNRC